MINTLYFSYLQGWLYDLTKSYDAGYGVAGICIAISGLILFFIPLVNKLEERRMPPSSQPPAANKSHNPPTIVVCTKDEDDDEYDDDDDDEVHVTVSAILNDGTSSS